MGVGVLYGQEGMHHTLQDGYQGRSFGLVRRHLLQDIYQRHDVPSFGTPPGLGTATRFGIAPAHRTTLVPSVMVQTVRFAGMLVHNEELTGDIAPCFGFGFVGRITGVERRAGEQAVQPHLVFIHLLMPESAFFCPRLLAQLVA